MVMCSLYSSSVMPELPTSNASRSFQPPTLPLSVNAATLFRMFMTLQWKPGSLQSQVVQGHRVSGRSNES